MTRATPCAGSAARHGPLGGRCAGVRDGRGGGQALAAARHVEGPDASGEQHQEPFLSINPRGEVPVLEDDGLVLHDSMAILVYLASKYDTGRWLPREPRAAAQVMEWLAFAASWIQYGVFTARAIVSFGITGNGIPHTHSGGLEEAQIRGTTSLQIMKQQLAGKNWLCGSAPTIADIACFPYIALAPMGDVSLTPYPDVRAWITRFQSLPGYLDMPGLDNPAYRRTNS